VDAIASVSPLLMGRSLSLPSGCHNMSLMTIQCMPQVSVCIRPVYVIGIRQIALRAFVIAGPSALGDTVQTGVPKGVKTDE